MPQARLNTGMPPTSIGSSALVEVKSKRTTRGANTTAAFTSPKRTRNCGDACLLISMSKLCFTSSANTGSPLLKRACGLIRKVTDNLSAATSISSASKP